LLNGGGQSQQQAPAPQPSMTAAPTTQAPMAQQQAPAQAAPAAPASTTGGPGNLFAGATTPAPAPAGPPPGVDPQVWNTLPDAQRQAVLAAMSTTAPTGGGAPASTTPF